MCQGWRLVDGVAVCHGVGVSRCGGSMSEGGGE